MSVTGTLEQILELARWAPSGDNTQPWRFELVDELRLVVHGFDTREHCVYDLDGRPSQISLGALLETMTVAASGFGLRMSVQRRLALPDHTPTFDLCFVVDAAVQPDPLLPYITRRSVQRRAVSTRPLTTLEKCSLEAAVGADYRIEWLEGLRNRWRAAWLMFRNANLRLSLPEAYRVHRDVIEWNARFSDDRVPDQALGVDPLTLRLMRVVMASWQRVEFFNTYLAGTLVPRIQMDLVPGLGCAAHLVIRANKAPATVDDFVAAGRAVQRLWLSATQLGLVHQPELTPLIFGSYVRRGLAFTGSAPLLQRARELEHVARGIIGAGADADRAVWMGRIGAGRPAAARSLRRPLGQLLQPGGTASGQPPPLR